MNIISWIRPGGIKSKIETFLQNYDIIGLREYINSKNLIDNDTIDNYFYSKYQVHASEFFNFFDEEGNVIGDYKNCLFLPHLIDFLCTVDTSIKKDFTELENKLLDYYHHQCSINSSSIENIGFCLQILQEYKNIKLEDIFEGNELKDSFYDNVVKHCLFESMSYEDLSDEFKKHFTDFELSTLKAINSENSSSKIKECIRELAATIKREELPKYIKISGHNKKKKLDVILSNETLPFVLFQKHLKEAILSQYNNNEDELNTYLSTYLNPVECKYFLLFDEKLDTFFNYYHYTNEDLNKIMYLKNDHLVFRPEFISNYIQDNISIEKKNKYEDVDDLLYILGNYMDKNDINNIHCEESGIKKDNLISYANIYKKISSYPDSLIVIYKHVNNIINDNSFLTMDNSKIDKYEEIFFYLCQKIFESNSPELKNFGGEILCQLLKNGNDIDYKDVLNKIEDIFSKNNLPIVGKKYSIYHLLHQVDMEEDLSNNSIISPTLKGIDKKERFEVIFNDLMRCTLGSNNISMRKYLENIYFGSQLYSKIIDKSLTIDKLPPRELETLTEFLNHLCTLYNQTKEGKEKPFNLTNNIANDLDKLIPLFKPTSRYSLPDRIIRMFGYSAGFKSFEDIYEYMNKTVTEANKRGRELAYQKLTLEKGDMVKGIDHQYLYDILQNGSLCKEFLGPSMDSDQTPLDTDLSLITEKKGSIMATMSETMANSYGSVYFVIKKGKIPMTRTEYNGETKFITKGPECFVTLSDEHVGIRTGFATSDIDFIIVEHDLGSLDEIKFSIALNGIYIPVIDKKTEKLLFSPEEYDSIRSKMEGLSYYDMNHFKLSNHLKVPIDYDNQELIKDAKIKKDSINKTVEKALKEKFGYEFKTYLSKDISVGGVELIDTGSTGRGTNIGKSSDFDFIMRIDEKANAEEISKILCESFGINYEQAILDNMVINDGNLRLKKIKLENISDLVDIDITFVSKANQITYSTDMAISDRLETIRKNDPTKYEDVLDNIIYAKKYLKDAEAYKPNHSKDSPQGGLGGVGIENWILQNGGSFYDACKSFYDAATEQGKMISFEKFCQKYKIYDFGANYYNGKHDEFVADNMTEKGYKKMYQAVCDYIKKNQFNYHYDNVEREMSYDNVNSENKSR